MIERRDDGAVVPHERCVRATPPDVEPACADGLAETAARARLEEQLRASEARWRAIVESAVDGIVVIDSAGHIEAFNPAAERLFGYAEREVIGQNVSMLMPSPYREEHDGHLARYLSTGVPRIIGTGRQVTGRRRDATTFPLRLSVGEMSVNGERKFTGILHDLSERIEIEEQLRDHAALAGLGEMAAVIAHEVKNPLAAVRGAIQVIGGRLPEHSKDGGVVQEIVSRIDALDELMTDLLLFARPPQPRPTLVDVAALIRTTADLFGSDPALKGVAVDIAGVVPPVPADAELLKIVFQNLLVNSAQAMQGRGAVHVTLARVDAMCHVTLRDAGPGMPGAVRERIFTPFYTTKARGAGLGLPMARRIVEAHGGSITVHCPPGGGTTVEVALPMATTP